MIVEISGTSCRCLEQSNAVRAEVHWRQMKSGADYYLKHFQKRIDLIAQTKNMNGISPTVDPRIKFLTDSYNFGPVGIHALPDTPINTKSEALGTMAKGISEARLTVAKQTGHRPPWLLARLIVLTGNRFVRVEATFTFEDNEDGSFRAGLERDEQERLKDLDLVLKAFLN